MKSPVYQARSLWNNLPPIMHNIADIGEFKIKCRPKSKLWEEYVESEVIRVSAGIFV